MFCGKCDFWIILLWKHEGKGNVAFAIFAIASGAVPGASRFDPSWLIYKPSSTSENPEITKKIGVVANLETKERKIPKQDNQVQYESLRIRSWFSFVPCFFSVIVPGRFECQVGKYDSKVNS